MAITLALRSTQIIFAFMTLSLSAYLIGSYGPGKAPPLLGYGSFCGACGLVVGLVGLGAILKDSIKHMVMLLLDAFASFFLVTGGIAFTVRNPRSSCSDPEPWRTANPIFGPSPSKNYTTPNDKEFTRRFLVDYKTRCGVYRADMVFLWLLFATFSVTLGIAMYYRLGKSRGPRCVVA